MSTITGIGVFLVAKRRILGHFWTCVWSSHLKRVNKHRDRHVPGRETQNSRSLLDSCMVLASQHSRNAELSSLLDLHLVVASQECQRLKVSTIKGIGMFLSAKRRTVVTFGFAFDLRISKDVNNHRDRHVPGREMQNGRDFWPCVWTSHLKHVNNHRDRHVPGRETQNSRSLLDLRLVFASQTCQQAQGSACSWSRNAEFSVTFGLVYGPRVSTVSTITGRGMFLVAKRRTVVTFGLAFGRRVSRMSTSQSVNNQRDRHVPVRETQNCRHFRICL